MNNPFVDFSHCVPEYNTGDLPNYLLHILLDMSFQTGYFVKVNSAYRSIDYEKSRGRSGTSSHTKHCAVDISCKDSASRFAFVEYLLNNGCPRIGISDTFIHFDYDFNKPSCLWLY